MVDWPGKLVATVFAQGCPWRCYYCHNNGIWDPRMPGQVPWSQVQELLAKRQGLLDGVVFSGGEPCRQGPALIAAIKEVRAQGFRVGLHTAGAYPRLLATLLDQGLVDWVGLDLKAFPGCYPALTKVANSGEKAWESARILAASGLDAEVRLTLTPELLGQEVEIAQRASQLGFRVFALQKVRAEGAPLPVVQRLMANRNWDADFARAADALSRVGRNWFTDLEIRS
ncbi:anaerobic ribonucleoside-triphosphate reductase activating protein [Boudabousia tangfeifanii]|uniref:Anaerobic ribonucleoside-triphosphate reductase activating protein n=2 Tax=Boudabousia tangfeifanii TaxID=1912795 RepID=A0A1D9MMZ3_9ACTO|nr:anaerobic ribonucleoside-triphosphate reductase activating protein [Boudabousia tangfeifanii]